MFDLRTDPVFRTTEGPMSLPSLLLALNDPSHDKNLRLTGIRPYQVDNVLAFLCTVGAAANQKGTVPTTQAAWVRALNAMAPEGTRTPFAWHLVAQKNEDDPRHDQEPAFFQPPWPDKPWNKAFTPDDVDGILTAANHSIKQRRLTDDHPDEWVYALITGNALAGPAGSGYGPASRRAMSGRLFLQVVDEHDSLGLRYRHGVTTWARMYEELQRDYHMAKDGGVIFPWLHSRSTPFALKELSPLYVDLTRTRRLFVEHGAVRGWMCIPDTVVKKGAPDIWTMLNVGPIPLPTGKAPKPARKPAKAEKTPKTTPSPLGISDRGADYRLITQVLFGPVLPPVLRAVAAQGAAAEYLKISGVQTDKASTIRYHERIIPLRAEGQDLLCAKRHMAAVTAATMLAYVDRVAGTLNHALEVLASGSFTTGTIRPESVCAKVIDRLKKEFTTHVDSIFWSSLWNLVSPVAPAQASEDPCIPTPTVSISLDPWFFQLETLARTLMDKAQQSMPVPRILVWTSMARDHIALNAGLVKCRNECAELQRGQEVYKAVMSTTPATEPQAPQTPSTSPPHPIALLLGWAKETPIQTVQGALSRGHTHTGWHEAMDVLRIGAWSTPEERTNAQRAIDIALTYRDSHAWGLGLGRALGRAGIDDVAVNRVLTAATPLVAYKHLQGLLARLTAGVDLRDVYALCTTTPTTPEGQEIRALVARQFVQSS